MNIAQNYLLILFSLPELDRRPGAGVSEMELVTEGDAVVGSHHHQKSGQGTDKGNKDRKGEVQGNVDAGADVDVPIFARLQHISAEGDPLSANVNSPQAQNLGAFSDDMLDSGGKIVDCSVHFEYSPK